MNLNCTHCGHTQSIPDKYAGKTVKCPKCKGSVKIAEKMQAGINRPDNPKGQRTGPF
jgi:phage FluMu protein Com